jgi:hypothetical protein
VLQHSAVVSAIVGVRTVDQLSGLDRAAALHLDVGAMARWMRSSTSTTAAGSAPDSRRRRTPGSARPLLRRGLRVAGEDEVTPAAATPHSKTVRTSLPRPSPSRSCSRRARRG